MYMTTTTRTETVHYTTETGEAATYENEIITFPVTIGNETREIEFSRFGDRNMARSAYIFGCRKGNGTKTHRTSAAIWYSNGKWVFDWNSGYALNSGNCLITDFADQVADRRKSEHVGTRF